MALPPSVKLAFKCMPVLIKAASEKRLLHYKDIELAIGHPAFYLSKPLAYVRDDICARHRLPSLTAIVVDSGTGLPGDSFLPHGRGDMDDDMYREVVEEYQAQVFEYPNWESVWENLKKHYGYVEGS